MNLEQHRKDAKYYKKMVGRKNPNKQSRLRKIVRNTINDRADKNYKTQRTALENYLNNP